MVAMPPGRLGRMLTLLVASSLLASILAAPVAAAPPSRADGARVVERGTVVARDAARAAVGHERAPSRHAPLPGPGKAAVADADAFAGAVGIDGTDGRTSPAPLTSSPELRSITAFDGISETGDGIAGWEPPDPWIAASATHLVQSTNGMVGITDRSGRRLVSVPTWALFALWPGELDADPRIVWDAVHGRWVGVVLSYQPDYSENYLNVAISEGADPTGAWQTFSIYYEDEYQEPTLPDYPGIASSSDKIVLTANEFQADGLGGVDYVGASILVMPWADLLAGASPTITLWTFADPTLFTIRPGQHVASAAPVHLVAMNGDYQVVYSRLTGTAPPEPTWQNVSLDTGLDGFCEATPPRQPGSPSTITSRIDGRPTDAVWRANRLAFVSTCAVTNDGGVTIDDYVRVTVLDTTAAAAAIGSDTLLGEGGVDSYFGGIGYSGDGTLFASYTRSSPTDYASTYAIAQYGGTWTSAIAVNEGSHTYAGTRWGDYVGVATDPAGSAAVWQANQVADASGDWQTRVSRLVLDVSAPTVTSAPNQALVKGSTIGGSTVPVKVSWTVSDPGSGVAQSWLQTDQFSTGLADARSVAGSSVTRSHWWRASTSTADRSYQYAVAGEDAFGNVGPIVTGSRLTAVVYQQTTSAFTYSSGWGSSSSSKYLGGSVKYSSTAGKYVTFKTSGRSFGFVTTRGSSRGKVKVYVDGTYKGTVTLTSSTAKYRNLAYVASYSTSGTHSIKLVVSSGRVDIDAFVVLK